MTATMRWEQPITCEEQYNLKDAMSVLIHLAKRDDSGDMGASLAAEEVTNTSSFKELDMT
jgi:hypothetical protein